MALREIDEFPKINYELFLDESISNFLEKHIPRPCSRKTPSNGYWVTEAQNMNRYIYIYVYTYTYTYIHVHITVVGVYNLHIVCIYICSYIQPTHNNNNNNNNNSILKLLISQLFPIYRADCDGDGMLPNLTTYFKIDRDIATRKCVKDVHLHWENRCVFFPYLFF